MNHQLLYFEIQATLPEQAIQFYASVFGWTFTLDPSIPEEYYRIEGGGIMGGLMKRQEGIVPAVRGTTNAFMCSMMVENFDETAKKILENGGKVVVEKMLIPGKCYQGYFIDTEKNVFGIFEPFQKEVL